MRAQILAISCAGAAVFARKLACWWNARSANDRPNILLVNTDDQPSWWVGAYGNTDVHTPTVDRLAAEGMLFKTAVTMRMIRTRGWKLIHHHENERKHELYDLQNDPGELINLYGRPATRDVQHFLARRLQAWEARVGVRKEDLLHRNRPY